MFLFQYPEENAYSKVSSHD